MEKLTVAIVFSALMITVLVDDSKGHDENNSSPCSCNNHNESALMTWTLNAKKSLYMACNTTANKAAIFDYTHGLYALFNGENGVAFILHFETGECTLIPQETSNKTWYAKDKTIREFMKTLPPLSELYSIGQKIGYQFDPQSISKDIEESLGEILKSLSAEWTESCSALGTALQIAKISSDKLKTSLKGFEEIAGDVDTPIRGDLKWLVGCFQGFANFFENFPGGINTLNEKHIRLDFRIIFSAKTGIHVLSYMVEELAPHFPHLGKTLRKALHPTDKFFVMIDNLSGHINSGFDGLIGVFPSIMQFIEGKKSEQDVLVKFQGYFNNPITESDMGQKWITAFQDLQKSVTKLQDCEEFKKLLDDIVKKQWIEGGVNMTEIIDVILQGGPKASENVVEKVKEYLGKNGS